MPLTGNINLPPPNSKPAAKYFHEDGDEALQALRKAPPNPFSLFFFITLEPRVE